MVKMNQVIGVALLVIAIALAGAFVYYQDIAPPANENTGSQDNTSAVYNGTVTAFQAFSVADKNAGLSAWKAGSKNVSIGQISSDFCTGGLSDTWTITYASDAEEAEAHVENGTMRGITLAKTPERLYPIQYMSINGLVDSDKAFDISNQALMNADMKPVGPAAARLVFKAEGTAIWEINYPLDGGSYIVRINARSGSITESATLRR